MYRVRFKITALKSEGTCPYVLKLALRTVNERLRLLLPDWRNTVEIAITVKPNTFLATHCEVFKSTHNGVPCEELKIWAEVEELR